MYKLNNKVKILIKYAIIFLIIEVLFLQLPIWNSIDDKANDYWIKLQASEQQVDEAIIIIDIDDKSLLEFEKEIGRWPWPRSVYGYLLEALNQQQTKAIVFDIMFSEKDLYRPDSDQYFNEVVNSNGSIYFAASLISNQSGIEKIALDRLPTSIIRDVQSSLKASEQISIILPSIITRDDVKTGLINLNSDGDGVSRHYPVYTQVAGVYLKSLAVLVVEDIYNRSIDVTSIRLNYKGKQQIPYKTVSFIDAFRLLTNSDDVDVSTIFKDKIVVIGSSATGLHDLRETPVSVIQPSVSILATAMDNLKNGDAYQQLNDSMQLVMTLLFSVFVGFWIFIKIDFKSFLRRTLITTVIVSISGVGVSWILSKQQILIPVATPIIFSWLCFVMINLFEGFREYLGRQRATRIFARFMDPRVVATLIENDDWQQSLKSRSGEITVLFSDIRGFTAISETRNAEQVIDLLNRYFDSQVGVIFKHGGTLDKFIGDAIMAFWGAPLSDDKQAINAVKAALEMSQNLQDFVTTLPAELHSFDIGIGIHTGPAVVGMLGASKRYDYTAIGDTVNLASRIEGVTKGRARVLISDATKRACGDSQEFKLKFKEAGEFKVKGRQKMVKLWEPLMGDNKEND